MSTFAEARWLAWREIKRTWLSYPATALGMLIFGLLTASIVDGFLILEGFGEGDRPFQDFFYAFYADLFFLIYGGFLTFNWMSREYLRVFSGDTFSARLAFVRSLPISVETMVLGRLISMCLALLLNAPAFFLTVYFVSNLSDLGWSFLWFVAVWIGYSLLGTGFYLLAEFTISGKTYTWLSFTWVLLLVVGLIFLELTVELRAVSRIAGLVESYGPLPALASVLLGAAALAILTKITIRRVERRDLYA